MQTGTLIKLPDGREGTTVYNFLDGVGIAWGDHRPLSESEEDWPEREAMLRDEYPSAREEGLECVGCSYEVVGLP